MEKERMEELRMMDMNKMIKWLRYLLENLNFGVLEFLWVLVRKWSLLLMLEETRFDCCFFL
jgi:hypothetical protein